MFLLLQCSTIQTNLFQFLLSGCLFFFPFIQLFLLRLNEGFQFFFILLGSLEFFCNILVIFTDLQCLPSQFILITVNLTIGFLDLLLFLLKLFQIQFAVFCSTYC